MKHTKKQETMDHTQDKKQSIGTISKEAQTLKLQTKSLSQHLLKELKETISGTLKESTRMMYHKIEHIIKKINY